MDFRELIYVTVVADCKSVTAAAKKLYISQPSLSQIIQRVENELGVKLFDRAAYPITLTYAGEKYVETARKILMMNDNLRRELTDIGNGVRGKISLGIPVERAGYMLPPVLQEFKKVYPGVEVRTQEAKSDILLESLKKGETNFVILPKDQRDLDSEMEVELIYKEELLFVAGPDVIGPEYLTADGAIDLVKAVKLPFIVLNKGHAIRKAVDSLMKAAHAAPNIIMETSSNINAVQLASSGYGVTIVPERGVKIFGGTRAFNCFPLAGEPYTWDVNVIYLKEAYLDGAERYLIEVMKKIFGRSTAEISP